MAKIQQFTKNVYSACYNWINPTFMKSCLSTRDQINNQTFQQRFAQVLRWWPSASPVHRQARPRDGQPKDNSFWEQNK